MTTANTPYFQQVTKWVGLYNQVQGAYHIEQLSEFEGKPANGYHIVTAGNTFQEVSERVSILLKGKRQ